MKTKVVLTLLSLVLLAGCAGTLKELPDGRFLSQVTAGDTLDRSSSYTQILEKVGTDAKGKPIFKQVAGDLRVGPTVGGQVVVGVTNGLGTALVNQHTAIKVAEKNACKGDGCGLGTVIVNDVKAGSVSNALSGSSVDVNAILGSCPSGDCVPVWTGAK